MYIDDDKNIEYNTDFKTDNDNTIRRTGRSIEEWSIAGKLIADTMGTQFRAFDPHFNFSDGTQLSKSFGFKLYDIFLNKQK